MNLATAIGAPSAARTVACSTNWSPIHWPRRSRCAAARRAARSCTRTAEAQYTARAMVAACADAGLRRSMGAPGICWDNSGAESVWSTYKHEYYYRHTFATKAEIAAAVDKWMYFYNNQRRHSVIGMLSHIAYEQSLNTAKQAA
jgi:transposase InsO family protein